MRRWLLGGVAAIATATLVAGGIVFWLARASLPQLAGELVLAGLEGPVTIVRDAHAIPHVTAQGEADAYRALGFLHGQDRLWQMEFDRLAGQGRLAEVLGAAALPHDRFIRTLGLAGAAERAAASLDPTTLALLEAYAGGVNAALAGYGFALPPEFLILRHRPEPWRPVDSVRFLKLMALDLSGNWRQELLRARLARELRPDQLTLLWPGSTMAGPVTMAALADLQLDRLAAILPDPPPSVIGSNVWAVAGARTVSGLPLLANDPHLRLQMPGHWYLAHLEAPELAVIGATLPGVPFVVLGRNRSLAWGFTNTGSDAQDLFIERLEPGTPEHYATPAGSEAFEVRRETLLVRDGPSETLAVRATRHGPVISDLVPAAAALAPTGHVLAMAWTQLQDPGPDTTMAGGFALGRAGTADAFVAAAELYRGAQQNMTFATRTGTIGIISPGLVPIRRSGDGRMPVPGWTGEHDWVGTIPAASLPRRTDPAGGQLVNANNRLVGDSYPYFLGADWEEPFRAERIEDMLGGAGRLDLDRMATIQLDLNTALMGDLRPFLPPPNTAIGEHREMLAALGVWDGVMRPDRPEPLLFASWQREFGTWLAGNFLGPEQAALGATRPGFLRRALALCPGTEASCRDAAARSFAAAVGALELEHGRDWRSWRWGDIHPALLGHRPFEVLPGLRNWFSRLVPVGGDATTVNVAAPGPVRDDIAYGSAHGAGFRAIYDLAHPDASRWIAATGQSGHVLSQHYDGFVAAWSAGHYLPMSMAPADHATDAIGTLRLMPDAAP